MPSKPAAKTTRPRTANAGAERTAVRVGIGGWTFAPWRDAFYPADLIQRRELEYASRQLRTIEINGTFYRAQSPAVYARWTSETPASFCFFGEGAAGYRAEAAPGRRGERASRFINGSLAELGPRLGPILWQFPPTRVFDCDDLAGFLDALPRTLEELPLRHVLEVRHDSFACAAYVDLACAHGVATVFTDSPDYPSLANISGDFVYARLMRSKAALKTGYAPKAFGEWAKLASQWAAGRDPVTLPHAGPLTKRVAPRELIVFSSAVPRNATRPPPSPCKKGVDALG